MVADGDGAGVRVAAGGDGDGSGERDAGDGLTRPESGGEGSGVAGTGAAVDVLDPAPDRSPAFPSGPERYVMPHPAASIAHRMPVALSLHVRPTIVTSPSFPWAPPMGPL